MPPVDAQVVRAQEGLSIHAARQRVDVVRVGVCEHVAAIGVEAVSSAVTTTTAAATAAVTACDVTGVTGSEVCRSPPTTRRRRRKEPIDLDNWSIIIIIIRGGLILLGMGP